MPDPRNAYKLDDVLPAHAKEALSHLEMFARRAVQGLLHGTHPSRRLGVSTEFDHHKSYQPGDPLKQIDWKASARHDRYYIKRSIEDSALTVRVVLDASASMLYRTEDLPTKHLHAARLAACLAYLVTGHGDAFGLTITNQSQTLWLQNGSTQRHLVSVLSALASTEPAPGSASADALPQCLKTLADRNTRRGMVILLSDLLCDPAPVQRELGRLLAQGHEVLVFQVRDPTEESFPFNRWVRFGDLENASVNHRVDAIILQRYYREEYARLCDEWRTWARRYDAHLVTVRTDDAVDAALSRYLAFRAGHAPHDNTNDSSD